MRLLILTQAVGLSHPRMGFFHGWLKEFAKRFESIIVICLEKGEYNLPSNVRVLSLGKEKLIIKGKRLRIFDRIKYIARFLRYIVIFLHDYDSVFVHMNQEYVLLGGFFWKIWGKRIFLWRNHAKGNFLTCLAIMFSNKVFCTSPQSFTAKFKKTEIMPVGIDTEFFKPDKLIVKKPNSILFLGRITPVKNVHIFIEALKILKDGGLDFVAAIAGSILPKDDGYEKEIRGKVKIYGLDKMVRFAGAVSQEEARRLYNAHQIFVNLTPSGSMDKTIFEAMACGLIPLSGNKGLKEILGSELFIKNPQDSRELSEKIRQALQSGKKYDFRNFVAENHGLDKLADTLKQQIFKQAKSR